MSTLSWEDAMGEFEELFVFMVVVVVSKKIRHKSRKKESQRAMFLALLT